MSNFSLSRPEGTPLNPGSLLACTRQDKHISLPNEIIILIYYYANEDTKYNMLLAMKWLFDIKIKCGNGVFCNNYAKYILQFKLKSNHKDCYDYNDLFFTKTVCSLKCKNTLKVQCKSLINLYKYLVYFGTMYYGHKPEYYNQYYSKILTDNEINVEYYIYGEDKCDKCNNEIFCERVSAFGYKLN